MSQVYVVGGDGTSAPMKRVRCRNEEKELQELLERNLDLLPGDQISPDNPRRWLLIKREMPVPDPGTGMDRWSVDFLLADQDGIPTFVECKRYADTRARREVVGQMIEYAANGHHYWSKELIRDFAEASMAGPDGLAGVLARLGIDSIDDYFEKIQENLRESQIRIVFFLEEAPPELRSIVDFLNRQMERSEVLLVEARQYTSAGIKVVNPVLFGYTEAARQIKRQVNVVSGKARRKWNEGSFFEDAASRLSSTEVARVREFYEACLNMGCHAGWGTGVNTASCNVRLASVSGRSLFSIWSDGRLQFNFGWLDRGEFSKRLLDDVLIAAGFEVPDLEKDSYPIYPKDVWLARKDELQSRLAKLVSAQAESCETLANREA